MKSRIMTALALMMVLPLVSCTSLRRVEFVRNDPGLSLNVTKGNEFYQREDWTKAIDHYRKALDVALARLGRDHTGIADIYENLGLAYFYIGDYAGARRFFELSLEIRNGRLEPSHPDLAFSYNNLGMVFAMTEDYALALSYYNRSIEIKRRRLGAYHPCLATTNNNIGMIYNKLGRFETAIEFFHDAIEINRLRSDIAGKTSLAKNYHNLGLAWISLANFKQAASCLEKSLHIFTGEIGEDHPDIIGLYYYLGICYEGISQMERSTEYFRKAAVRGNPDAIEWLTQMKH